MADDRERSESIPAFRRYGLGYQYRPPEAPVVMTFTNVVEKRSSGEIRAEVHVQGADGGHVLRRYLNLMGSNSVRDLAKDLTGASNGGGYPWTVILEAATESIINASRIGPEPESFGGMTDRPPGISWLCEGLVMANVPNVWLAAASTGKSTFSALLALYHAVGHPFLGRPTTRGTTLYLDWESTGDDLAEKLWLGSRWLDLSSVPHGIHRMQMRGPASMHASAIANRIDQIGATLVIWDGVQAAGGPIGQHASYESVAMDLEAMVAMLPPTTHLMLDHVTGDDLKDGKVPLKARGGTRKVEWARNQWSLILDRDAHADRRHVVGWTHTKINRAEYLRPFGVEIVHRPDELGFQMLGEREVKPLRERMEDWRNILGIVQEAGRPLMTREVAQLWKGEANEKAMKEVNQIVRIYGRAFVRDDNGMILPRELSNHVGANGTTTVIERSHEEPRPLFDDGDDLEDLPF